MTVLESLTAVMLLVIARSCVVQMFCRRTGKFAAGRFVAGRFVGVRVVCLREQFLVKFKEATVSARW